MQNENGAQSAYITDKNLLPHHGRVVDNKTGKAKKNAVIAFTVLLGGQDNIAQVERLLDALVCQKDECSTDAWPHQYNMMVDSEPSSEKHDALVDAFHAYRARVVKERRLVRYCEHSLTLVLLLLVLLMLMLIFLLLC